MACAKCKEEYEGVDELFESYPELYPEFEGEVGSSSGRNTREYVAWVQRALNRALGLSLATDGTVGTQTRAAVRAFQQRQGVAADGIVGPATEQRLAAATGTTPPRPGGRAAGCVPVFVDCPNPASPFEVLDRFAFDRAQLIPSLHGPKIARIARAVVSSQGSKSPVRRILIAGHTDAAGDDNYNFALSRKRAQAVLDALCPAIERLKPGLIKSLRFEITPCGERQTKSKPDVSRRVEVFLDPIPPSQLPNPPDHAYCSVPRKKKVSAAEVNAEFRELGEVRRTVTALPRLSIFQNANDQTDRNHFNCGASRWARRIRAIGSPNASACRSLVGPTPYDTGEDIIRAIDAGNTCAGPIQTVHIFSHSGSNGVYGTTGGRVGLYVNGPEAGDRSQGGRNVTDIPTAPLAANAVFVLHGCNTAAGDENLARALFEHLSGALQSPKVFGHHNSGCASRDNSWREYSGRSTLGTVRLRTLAPTYQDVGCCA